MEQGMLSPSLGANVTAGAGGLRDAYLAHIEQAAEKGLQPLPFPEFVKMLQQQQMQQQQPQQGMFQRLFK